MTDKQTELTALLSALMLSVINVLLQRYKTLTDHFVCGEVDITRQDNKVTNNTNTTRNKTYNRAAHGLRTYNVQNSPKLASLWTIGQ